MTHGAERDGVGTRANERLSSAACDGGRTGVLNVFLDGLDSTSVESTVVVPVVLGATSAHQALADLQLRIVLQAVGALLPVPSFVLEEHHLDHTPQYVDAWKHRFGPIVAAVTATVRAEPAKPCQALLTPGGQAPDQGSSSDRAGASNR